MRVIHVTEAHRAEDGGLTTAVNDLAALGARRGWSTAVVTSGVERATVPPGVESVHIPPWPLAARWLWSSGLGGQLEKLILAKPQTVVHLHGFWMAPQYYAGSLALKHGIPVVLTPHNLLSAWGLRQQGLLRALKKSIYWKLFVGRTISAVDVIHAVTKKESDELRLRFPGARIEVISHSIDSILSKIGKVGMEPGPEAGQAGIERVIVFLGRIHPVKGLDILVEAFARSRLWPSWRLVIIGPIEDQQYFQSIRSRAEELNLTDSIIYAGPIFGDEKYRFLKKAWIVAAPSRTEVAGLVNLESAACGTPSLTTFETGLDDWEEKGGLLCNPIVDDIEKKLDQMCYWSLEERIQRGGSLRRYVIDTHSDSVVGAKWEQVYKGLIDRAMTS